MKIIKLIILFMVSTLGLGACVTTVGTTANSNYNSSRPISSDTIIKEKWLLESINNVSYRDSKVSLQLSNQRRINGYSGCNRFFASVTELTENRIQFGSVGSTRKLCSNPRSNQLEKTFLNALRGVTHYQKNVNRLVFEGSRARLVFYKARP